jgi:hypothetical protein
MDGSRSRRTEQPQGRRGLYQGPAATAALSRLDINPEWLATAVIASEIARRNTSPLEPVSAPGSNAWFAGVRRLTENILQGSPDWVRRDEKNLPRLINTQSGVTIAMCGGDQGVGLPGRSPRTRGEKGNESAEMVRVNVAQQLALFGDQGPQFRPVPPRENRNNWWLLYYSDGIQVLRANASSWTCRQRRMEAFPVSRTRRQNSRSGFARAAKESGHDGQREPHTSGAGAERLQQQGAGCAL